LKGLLALPQQLAEWFDCQVVIMFYNFPHIRSWDRQGKWETHLRQEIQRQSRVSYALVATVAEPWMYCQPAPRDCPGSPQRYELAALDYQQHGHRWAQV
jgi:hypothetical protein